MSQLRIKPQNADSLQRWRWWVRERFTRDRVLGNLKTLAWVVPLTLLIWIYAERQQISTLRGEPLPFRLVSADPSRFVSLTPRQDTNLIVDLEGPQARVLQVLKEFRGGIGPMGIPLEIDTSLSTGRDHELNTVELLRRQRVFEENGITVRRCQPTKLMVFIDEAVERDARIVLPPSVKNVDVTFEPPTVKLRGPRSVLDESARANGDRLVIYADVPESTLRTPGDYDLTDVQLRRSADLQSDDRVTVVAPPKIRGTLRVRAADVVGVIRSMPVWLSAPPGLWNKYTYDPAVFKGFLQNVHIVGPKDLVDQITRPDYTPGPKAWIEVTDADVRAVKQKVPHYELPPPVRVSDEDQNRTVEIKLVDRTTGE